MTAWLLAWVVLSGCAGTAPGSASWSDAPDPLPMAAARAAGPASYDEALRIWKTPEDIAAWSAARFAYDTDRALQLSETERQKGADPTIPAPADLFERPTGTCLDLARFGLETLQRIDPQSRPRYLMVEFEPLQLKGRTLRRHWLVSFRRGDGVYVFADSKRPWLVAGPYEFRRRLHPGVRALPGAEHRPLLRDGLLPPAAAPDPYGRPVTPAVEISVGAAFQPRSVQRRGIAAGKPLPQ